jgi:predicted nucleic acid-binding protein
MTALFADTFYWIALADFADSAHARAVAIASERAGSPLVTTDEVLVEYLTLINAERILDHPGVRVVPQMQTMRIEGLTEVLPNDRHFEQEGFRPLFRES